MSRRATCTERQIFCQRIRSEAHLCDRQPGLRSALYRVCSQDKRVKVRDLIAFGCRTDNLGKSVTWQIGSTKAVVSKC